MKVLIIHASIHGHTAALAKAIAEGARDVPGADVILKPVEETDHNELASADAIIWGCSSYFGEPNPKMAEFFSKTGRLWLNESLQGKVGGVFATASSQHGGIENILRSLQTCMQHHGMILVSNTGRMTEERVRYSSPYGAIAVIPTEESRDSPMNQPNHYEIGFARDYGRHVTTVAQKLSREIAPV